MLELILENDKHKMNWIEGNTEWGTVNAPVYTAGGLEGAVFEIYDSEMMLVATMPGRQAQPPCRMLVP